ncbi:LysR family transcriptional regulator [Psychrobacillus sp. FSL K6-2836]|uniref:LysR family transcriptional regulator n=1 Tax=Psychrobacillus sp. FSL K6-2836 TaxID=2921548 RepID=UPI0030FC87AE
MNIEQLTYIVEVANSNSLATAAKTLNISQSALSQAITKLESELNLKIFNRSRTGAVTTKEGDYIVEKAKSALNAIYQIKEEAKNQLNNLNDVLRLSTIPGLADPIIDTYLSYSKRGSHLKVEVDEKSSLEIIEDIISNKIDIGFIALNKTNTNLVNELNFTPIIEGKILVYASNESHIAKTNDVVTADLLKKQTFVLYKDEYVQGFITNFQRLYGPINISFKTTNLDMITKAVTELGFVTIGHDVSTKFNPNYPSNKMTTLSIVDSFDTSFRFGWIKKNENKLSEQAKLYVNEVNEILTKK